jgi:hypothetical protein
MSRRFASPRRGSEGEWIETVQSRATASSAVQVGGATAAGQRRSGTIRSVVPPATPDDSDVVPVFARRRVALLFGGLSAAALAILGASQWQAAGRHRMHHRRAAVRR